VAAPIYWRVSVFVTMHLDQRRLKDPADVNYFSLLKVVETVRKALAGERVPDGDRPADKEAVQDVAHRGDARDRGGEGGHGCEDGAQVPAGAALAERNESGAALAHAAGCLLVKVWPEIAAQLGANAALEAKTLFARLQQQYPERFVDGQLRTLQRYLQLLELAAREGEARVEDALRACC
jgi:hypothetical protein